MRGKARDPFQLFLLSLSKIKNMIIKEMRSNKKVIKLYIKLYDIIPDREEDH